MDKLKLLQILCFTAIGLLVLSMPAAWWISTTAGMVCRWSGIILACVYFFLRNKFSKDA